MAPTQHDPLAQGIMTRRHFLRMSGVAGLSLAAGGLLAACGDGTAGTTATIAGTAAPGTTPVLGGVLDHFTYEGYDLAGYVDPWLTASGITQNVSFIGSQADVEAKLLSPSGRGIDLTSANQSWIASYLEFGIVRPITVEEVPSLAKLYPRFQEFPYRNDDGTFNAVPWTWGPLGLTYSPDRVDEEPENWDIMFDPAFTNRVVMLDDGLTNMGLAAVILGYNPDELTREQFEDVKDFLRRLLAQTKTLAPGYGDIISLFAAGEVDLNFLGWVGTDVLIEGGTAKTIVPAKNPDGSPGSALGYVDCAMIPPDADNVPAALGFCEQLISGQAAADVARDFVAGVTNPEVEALLSEEARAMFPYGDLDSYFQRVYLPSGFPRESDEFVTHGETFTAWDELKAEVL